MVEFTGNVHALEMTHPFPPPEDGAGDVFVIGRTFGDSEGDANASTQGLDVWIDDAEETVFDPPDGDAVTIPLATLLACTHGWLRFVKAGEPVPGMLSRTGEPVTVERDSLLFTVWPTLRDNLERMAVDGSVQIPQTAVGKGGRPALDLLLYENVDPLPTLGAVAALIDESRPPDFFDDDQRDAMIDAFFEGELQILVRAGREIGVAAGGAAAGVSAPAGAGPNWKRITFRAADRFGQLFDPGYFLRRVRELGELTFLIPFLSDAWLIPSKAAVANHPLPALTPARRIVDWRDEYGRPVADVAFLLAPEGATAGTVPEISTNAWGLWLGEILAAGAQPHDVETVIVAAATDVEQIAIGTLPHAASSAFRLFRDMMADDYLILSALDIKKWFLERPAPTSPLDAPLRHFTERNRVTPLVDGREALLEMYKAMRRTFRDDDFSSYEPGDTLPDGALFSESERAEHYIYNCGWKLSPHIHLPQLPATYQEIGFDVDGNPLTPYDPQGHAMGVLRAAIDAGVDVRALLWRQLQLDPKPEDDNTAAVSQINALSVATPPRRGQAILDEETRPVGSHHQKLTVIANADGRVAFVGGVDLACDRWDSNEHLPNDPRSQNGRAGTDDEPWSGWHDVHCRVEGPAVDDLENNIRQRWNANPDAQTDGRSNIPSLTVEEPIIPDASHFVQINRTIPSRLASTPFVSSASGDLSALRARFNAIEKAREYVYIEEQYLTMVDMDDYVALKDSMKPEDFEPTHGDTIAAALRKKIMGADPNFFVAILIPRTLVEEPAFANNIIYEMRKRFIEFITLGLSVEEIRERLLVFHLRNRTGVPTYVHAKTMIVDDIWASIGSSNIGYRSMTFDSEINCDVVDGAIRKGKRRFAQDLRIRLMAEHLRLPPNARHRLVEPRKGFDLLRRGAEQDLPQPHHILAYDPDYLGDDLAAPGAPPPYNPDNLDHELVRVRFVDPDGRDDDGLFDYQELLEKILAFV